MVVPGRLQLVEERLQRVLVGALRLGQRLLDQHPAFDQLEADVQAGVVLLHDLAAPALEQIAPRLDGVEIAAVAMHREPAGPAVVVDRRQRRLAPVGLVLGAVLDRGGDLVMAVAEHVGLDLDHVADHALDRMAPAVELGIEMLDHDPGAGELEQALLRGLLRRLGDPRGRLQGLGVAAEDAQRQGLEADRFARLERCRRAIGRDVLEAADPPARLVDQRARVDAAKARLIRVDQHDRGVVRGGDVPARKAEQTDDRAVRRGDLALRPFGVQRGRCRLHRVDLADVAGEVDARPLRLPLPVARARADHVHARPAAVFVAHRDHDAAREGGREQVAEAVLPLELGRLEVAQVRRQALGVVALRKGDRRRDVTVQLVLLEQPRRAEVPPLRAVEHVVEARRLERQHLLGRAAQRLGEEAALRVEGLGLLEDRPPDLDRHLIGGIAAKALEAELQVMAHQLHPVLDQGRARVRIVVGDLGEVAPDGELARIDRIDRARRVQLAIAVAPVPLRVLLDQDGVLGRVVEHQVHHRRDAAPGRGLGEALEQRIRRGVVGCQQGVQPVVVLDRIEAAREARVVERVDVDPVEAHRRDPLEMIGPRRHRPGEQREEVVDPRARHGDSLLEHPPLIDRGGSRVPRPGSGRSGPRCASADVSSSAP